jgi:Stealth protein CR1, conserved region 1
MTIPVDLRRTTLHVPRSAKPAWLRRAGLRKRRNFLALILTVALLGLFPTISRGYTIFKDFVLYDPLWSYTYVNASDKMFPPQDPTYIVFEPPKFDPHVDQLEGRRLLPSCIDGYFAKGAPCHAGSDPPLDVVWTWVNGSDRLIQESMAHVVRTTTPKMPYTSRANTWYFRCVALCALQFLH